MKLYSSTKPRYFFGKVKMLSECWWVWVCRRSRLGFTTSSDCLSDRQKGFAAASPASTETYTRYIQTPIRPSMLSPELSCGVLYTLKAGCLFTSGNVKIIAGHKGPPFICCLDESHPGEGFPDQTIHIGILLHKLRHKNTRSSWIDFSLFCILFSKPFEWKTEEARGKNLRGPSNPFEGSPCTPSLPRSFHSSSPSASISRT